MRKASITWEYTSKHKGWHYAWFNQILFLHTKQILLHCFQEMIYIIRKKFWQCCFGKVGVEVPFILVCNLYTWKTEWNLFYREWKQEKKEKKVVLKKLFFNSFNWTLTEKVMWSLLVLSTVSKSITVKNYLVHVVLLISHHLR